MRAARTFSALLALLFIAGCLGGRLEYAPAARPDTKSGISACGDPPQRQAWRVRLRRGRQDSVFTVLVERDVQSGFGVAALNDVGGTLFQASAAGDGSAVVIQRNLLRIPDSVLARTFVQDALLPFLAHPPETASAGFLENGRSIRVNRLSRNRASIYVLSDSGNTIAEFLRLRGHHIAYHARFNTPGQPFEGGHEIISYSPRYAAAYRPLDTGQ